MNRCLYCHSLLLSIYEVLTEFLNIELVSHCCLILLFAGTLKVETSEAKNTGRIFLGYGKRDHYGDVGADNISESGCENTNLD
jgi:hypothetical protein